MTKNHLTDALTRLPIGSLCNAHPRVTALGASIRPLWPGTKVAGPAKTALISPGQNAAIHRAVHTAQMGDVLVVEGDGDRLHGAFGDLLTEACQKKGIAGAVLDSTIRDTAGITRMKFPVFSLGANPTGTAKTDPGKIDVEITCGRARVRPGDFIVGDDDGVVVIPRQIAASVIPLARAVVEREEAARASLDRGKSTCEIFDIPV